MLDLGDRTEDSTIDFAFSTKDTSSVPTTLSGTPAISVYKTNSTTESTAGVTLTADFDSVTGLNHVRIDTSADAFYAASSDYMVVITTGTVDSVSYVGTVVATFSIANRGSTPAKIVTQLFATVTEGSETFVQALRLMRSALVGKLSQSGSTVNIRDAADSKNRISSSVDVNGQRTAVTTDGS